MDNSKYNLRCNRIISERMLKKDFIYEIKRLPGERWLTPQKNPVPEENSRMTLQDTPRVPFRCNFCGESIATLMSLSTHVKSHLRNYCRICYWIFESAETAEEHVRQKHPITSSN
ncbi:protein suppressor of hairy wing [Fopius arisanus]|uniref:Protein suppressor of hairy wing n=1 Tax=Fopius arisanus TaxID=64838 RepID=A0A9R1U000_9HYME|nr:PREDICTED: protein suppressor of hairy wing-like [Fopius arisanus]